MDLTFTEKLLIVSINPDNGRLKLSGNYLTYGMAGSVLLEFYNSGKIEIEKNNLKLKSRKSTGDPVVDRIIKKIQNSKKDKKVRYWLRKLSYKGLYFKRKALRSLFHKNILRCEKRRFLNLIPYKRYYFLKLNIRKNLISELRAAIFHSKDPEQQDIMLLALIKACSLDHQLSKNKEEKRIIKKHLKELSKENKITESINKIIREIQAAVTVSAVTASA